MAGVLECISFHKGVTTVLLLFPVYRNRNGIRGFQSLCFQPLKTITSAQGTCTIKSLAFFQRINEKLCVTLLRLSLSQPSFKWSEILEGLINSKWLTLLLNSERGVNQQVESGPSGPFSVAVIWSLWNTCPTQCEEMHPVLLGWECWS